MRALKAIGALLSSELFLKYLTLFAVVASAVVYYLQLVAMQGQLFTLKEQEDTQLRAYIGATGAILTKVDVATGKMQVSVTVKNFGSTPAFNVDAGSFSEVQFPTKDGMAANDDPNFPDASRYQMLNPTDEITYDIPVSASADEVKDIRAGKKEIAAQLKIYYRTVFKKDVWSTVCYIFKGSDIDDVLNGNTKVTTSIGDSKPEEFDVSPSGDKCGNGFDGS